MDKDLMLQKLWARAECENCMNRYEYNLSHCLLEKAADEFTTKMDDVRCELSFGKWVGPEGIKRCFLGMHAKLFLGPDGLPATGCFHLNNNTTEILEVADDLKTAKGLWVCPGTYNNPDPDSPWGSSSQEGACLRAADFIFEEDTGKWKIWHYVVTGLMCYRFGEEPGQTTAVQDESQWEQFFDESSKPDSKPDHFWTYTGKARIENANYNRCPEPYRTFSETFSY